MKSKMITNNLVERYSRQIVLPQIKKEGQAKIGKAKVAIIGLGALGTPAAELLARAGCGELLLIDQDTVEESNLQRQLLYTEKDSGKSKSLCVQEHLKAINSQIKIKTQAVHLNTKNISFLKNYDLILDCTDNLQTRFLINDYCKKEKKPWVYAAAISTKGYVIPILPNGPCLNCFIPESKAGSLDTCSTAGVLNTLTTAIASLQVTLALQIILGHKVVPTLYHLDMWNLELKKIDIKKRKDCFACRGVYKHLDNKKEQKMVRLCSSGSYLVQTNELDFSKIKKRYHQVKLLNSKKEVFHLGKITVFADGRVFVRAKSEEDAWAQYCKWIGN